tara:strand:+ start:2177 stop:2620 length:444 start_codon:yes stop_codon:yes gene_type:complete
MHTQYITCNSKETHKLGQELAKEILKTKLKKALVIGLKGELGGGKTTFVQGLAKGLGVKEKVLSPTFLIVKRFELKNKSNLFHIDCYRIKGVKDLKGLGLKDMISNPKNIIVIEWYQRIEKALPKDIIIIGFKVVDEDTREIVVSDL